MMIEWLMQRREDRQDRFSIISSNMPRRVSLAEYSTLERIQGLWTYNEHIESSTRETNTN